MRAGAERLIGGTAVFPLGVRASESCWPWEDRLVARFAGGAVTTTDESHRPSGPFICRQCRASVDPADPDVHEFRVLAVNFDTDGAEWLSFCGKDCAGAYSQRRRREQHRPMAP
jgi:hypothetical protein